jgi:hypothetical protein
MAVSCLCISNTESGMTAFREIFLFSLMEFLLALTLGFACTRSDFVVF